MAQIVEHLAQGVVELRVAHTKRYKIECDQQSLYGGPPPKQTIVGGYVRSYSFQYDPNNVIAQGTMTIESNETHHEQEVTILFLTDEEADNGKTGERIVEQTQKLSYCADSVVEAYFSAYCEAVGRWVVVYEKFDGFFEGDNDVVPSFFYDEHKTFLGKFWKAKLRSIIHTISLSRGRKVVHGGLSQRSSYVFSSETVKLINIGRFKYSTTHAGDVYDLRKFIETDPFFDVQGSQDWDGFSYLLGSKKMQYSGWDTALLNHPILLDPDEVLIGFEELELYMYRVPYSTLTRFANALYVKFPTFRHRSLYFLINKQNSVLRGVFDNTNPHRIIYMAIIQYIRNIHLHANDHTVKPWDSAQMIVEINKLFPGFMSMAYSLRCAASADWSDLLESPAIAHLHCHFYKPVAIEKCGIDPYERDNP